MLDNRRTKLFLVPVGCKGDWPAFVQMEQLMRHFGHMAKKGGAQIKSICHLCAAGMEGVPWHEFGVTASWHLYQDELPKLGTRTGHPRCSAWLLTLTLLRFFQDRFIPHLPQGNFRRSGCFSGGHHTGVAASVQE